MKFLFFSLVFLILKFEVCDTYITCAVVKRKVEDHTFVFQPKQCPPGKTEFSIAEVFKFYKEDEVTTALELKVGQTIYIRIDESELSNFKKQNPQFFDNRDKRGIQFFWLPFVLFSASTAVAIYGGIVWNDNFDYHKPHYVINNPDKLDDTYIKLLEKQDALANFNNTLSHAINHLAVLNGPHYVAPKRSAPAKNTNNKRNKQCASSHSGKVYKVENFLSGKQNVVSPGGQPPPTPSPNFQKKLPDDAIIFLNEDGEEEDVIDVDLSVEEIENPNEMVLRDENFEVEIINQNEIHLELAPSSSSSVIRVTHCQPSTSNAKYNIAIPNTSGRHYDAEGYEILTLSTSSSEEELEPLIPSIQLALPPTLPKPGTVRTPQISRPPIPDDLQWIGLVWGTRSSGITNTCNFDSFLSHITYLARRHQFYFERHLNLVDSNFENAVRTISRLATEQNINHFTYSRRAHQIWRDALSDPSRTNPTQFPISGEPPGVVDMAGSSYENVVVPLTDSSTVLFFHHCECKNEENTNFETSANEIEQFKVWTAEDLRDVNEGTYKTKKTKKRCKKCKSQFKSNLGAGVSTATWVHSFATPDVANFREYPETMTFLNIQTGQRIYFDIGYYSFTTRMPYELKIGEKSLRLRKRPFVLNNSVILGHTVSIQRVERELVFYDGMQKEGNHQPIPSNLHDKYRMNYVVYFKQNNKFFSCQFIN